MEYFNLVRAHKPKFVLFFAITRSEFFPLSDPFCFLFLGPFTLATFRFSDSFWLSQKVGCHLWAKSGNGTLIDYRYNDGPFYHHFCAITDNVVFQFATSECRRYPKPTVVRIDPILALTSAYQEYLVTFKSMTS